MAVQKGSPSGNDQLEDLSNSEPIDKRKMFVGGLSLDTSEDDMKEYFTQFGPVVHSVVKRDPTTGRSRCFGFVTFANSLSIKKVAEMKDHLLKGRRIDPKAAEPRTADEGIMKIFVGGIDSNMSDEDLKAYFEKFGTVKLLEWPRDRMRNNQKKNFAFVEFDEERVVNEVVRNAKQEIGGRMCDVRKAIPPAQKAMQQQQQQQHHHGMGMDRNAGWGDYSGGGGGGGYGGGGNGGGYGGGSAYDQYAAAAAAYGFASPEQFAAYYNQYADPSSFFTDPNAMAAYYGAAYGADYSGGGGTNNAFDYAAAAAGYASGGGYGAFAGNGDAFKRGGMRGAAGGTSPRGGGAGFGAKPPGMNGAAAAARGGARGGAAYHPYRR